MLDGIETTPQPLFIAPAHLMVWADRVRPHVGKMAASSGGRFELPDILTAIAAGRMQLWIVLHGSDLRGVIITEVLDYPRLRAMRIVGLVGHRMRSWVHLLAALEATAKRDFGCSMMEVLHAPKLAVMLAGYKPTHVLSEKALA